ncbi:hypothetical protein M0R45_032605 [Rubus argutus]|uniref:Uncharacterized protein n=1 Tax=Rubus argutus TaxID=59490 RepID=A0AAW1WKQ6_RUBAR
MSHQSSPAIPPPSPCSSPPQAQLLRLFTIIPAPFLLCHHCHRRRAHFVLLPPCPCSSSSRVWRRFLPSPMLTTSSPLLSLTAVSTKLSRQESTALPQQTTVPAIQKSCTATINHAAPPQIRQSHLANAAIPLSCPASISSLFSSNQAKPDPLSLSIN